MSIPQHIRPFLDTTHQPSEGGFVPSGRPDARDDVNLAADYYYKIRPLSPVRHPVTNRVLSAYSGVELKPLASFSGHQFDEYVFHAARKGRLFMFRVEKQAAVTGHRHARGLESTRCRFARCPLNGTIRPGQIRVCISEFLDPENKILDPYQNAAYVHLYCLEKFCTLPSILAETNVTFLPAGQLAKESSFPPALNPAEREACLEWTHQARQSWRDFKRAYPLPEARPRYNPSDHNRLHYRLEKIRENEKVIRKRRHGDYNGPQVYTYNGQGQRNPAPEPAPKKPRTIPPSIPIPPSSRDSGLQIYQGVPGLPYQTQPPASQPVAYKPNNVAATVPLPSSPGDFLPSGLAEVDETQLSPNGAADPGQGAEYSTEGIDSFLAEYFVDDFANFLESALEEPPWRDPPAAPPPAAGPQEGARSGGGPQQSPKPEQAPRVAQDSQPAAAAKSPVGTKARRKLRRASAPPVLSLSARVRKSSASSRRSSKAEDFPGLE